MADTDPFPDLPSNWEPTRAALHAHTRVLGAVARAHAPAAADWSHVALTPTADRLLTAPLRLEGGRTARLALDLPGGEAVVIADDVDVDSRPLSGDIAEWAFGRLRELGLPPTWDRDRLLEVPATGYDPAAAETFWETLRHVADLFEAHRRTLPGDPGPVHLWPHGFDLAVEWYGTRIVKGSEGTARAQLNLGWYPTGDAYFYSNPWPFDESLLDLDLPAPARWHTDGWKGTILHHADLAGRVDGDSVVREYAAAVFALAEPTLQAG